ncbi:MAG: sulfite exporter TauE/SafE family protein [bacterium]|nr:sulfite exporter TauE/SafE family protein [bacterium]
MRTQDGQVLLDIQTSGMHCRSCELLVEQSIKKLPGVGKVQANADRNRVRVMCDQQQVPTPQQIGEAIKHHGYSVVTGMVQPVGTPEFKRQPNVQATAHRERPTIAQIAGAFIIVLVIGFVLSKAGFLKFNQAVDGSAGFFSVLFLGLVAASSSCIAVSGGLLLSTVERVSDRYGILPGKKRFIPVSTFVLGRTVGYTVFGALIAGLGKALALPPWAVGLIAILAALFMLVMGLDMLRIAPTWLKVILPRMPKFISRKVMSGGETGKVTYASPFILGALTFFLPCGFTQALQLYVLTTGNVVAGALIMLAFALGTAPALLALGWASNALKGQWGKLFFRVAGAAVIVMGIYNFNNGLTLMGRPISFNFGSSKDSAASAASVVQEGDVQVVKTSLTPSGYSPETFTVKAGQPVRWEIDGNGNAGGCRSVFQVPAFKIQKFMSNDVTIAEFTPDKPGTYSFSCSMGMYRGSFTVIEA